MATGINGLGIALSEVVQKISDTAGNIAKIVTGGSTTTPTNTVMTVTASSLVLRDAPTTSGTKITSITKGNKVTVKDANEISANGFHWIKVDYNGKVGYVAKEYLSASSTPTPAPTPAPVAVKTTDTTTSDSTVTTDKTTEKKNMFTLSDTTKKYIKWGVIGAAVLGVGYFAYSKLSKKKSTGTSGLSGIGHKKSKKHKKVEKMYLS